MTVESLNRNLPFELMVHDSMPIDALRYAVEKSHIHFSPEAIIEKASFELTRQNIESIKHRFDDEIILEWEKNSIFCSLTIWTDDRDAYFTSMLRGVKVKSEKFNNLASLEENISSIINFA